MSKQTPRDKAALVDFGNLQATQRTTHSRQTIGTAPGQAMQNSLLRVELEQWNGAKPVRHLDPTTVIRSKWANRHEQSFQDEEFKLLKEDIESAGGNVQPIKVRPAPDKPGHYEVIFGHRRHQACLELGFPVLAMIAGDVDDQQMFVEMDRENRQRKDLRPYEQGMMYGHALKEKMFPSAKKMAEALGVNLGSMGRTLALARLPDYVIGAFKSPLDLQYRWADDLSRAVAERPQEVEEIAKAIKQEGENLSAKQVYEQLIGNGQNQGRDDATHKVKFEGSSGQSGRIVVDPVRKSVTVNLLNLDLSRVQNLEDLLKKFIS